MVSHPAIKEAAAIAVPDELKGDVVVVLAVARERAARATRCAANCSRIVDRTLGKSLRPKAIHFVDDLPKTRNMKVMRRVARGRYLGLENLGDLSALDNPGALTAIDERR